MDFANTFQEEQRQLVYAPRMGLVPTWLTEYPPSFNGRGASIIDIGGGPVSLLLKTVNRGRSVVMDPGQYPDWTVMRYQDAGIEFWRQPGEELDGYTFDEAWIYDTLNSVLDPERVIANALSVAGIVRIFEWIEPYEEQLHVLTREVLDHWLGGAGFVANLDEDGCVGVSYYGVFRGSNVPSLPR